MSPEDPDFSVFREAPKTIVVKNSSIVGVFVYVNENVAIRFGYLLDETLQRRQICVRENKECLRSNGPL